MEPLRDYLTLEGWKKDWYQTRQDFSNLYDNRNELSDLLGNQRGATTTSMMFTTVGLCMSTVGMTTDNNGLMAGGVLMCLAGVVGAIGDYKNRNSDDD